MFKVGDIVVGKHRLTNPIYGVTNHEAVMEVVVVPQDSPKMMRVKVLAHKLRDAYIGKEFPVAQRHFELYIPEQAKVIVSSTDYMDCDALSIEDKQIITEALSND